MNTIQFEPIAAKTFGAVVRGVAVDSVSAAQFQAIESALVKYGFLVFHNQQLSVEDNKTFGRRFGELEFGGLPMANQDRREDGSWGDVLHINSQRMRTNVGNEAWHTDSTYWPISSKCAMLYAITVPEEGGETELADTRAAYAALDAKWRDRIENLAAYHSTQFSQANDLGDFPEQADGTIYHGEAYLRPLVKTHPVSGVRNLFVGRHAFGIPGLSREDSRTLIADLTQFVVSDPARVYSHSWSPGDLLVWDNRTLLHRARPYDYSQPRALIATRVAGDEVSELSYYPDDPRAELGRAALAAELKCLYSEAANKRYGDLGRHAPDVDPMTRTSRPGSRRRVDSVGDDSVGDTP